MITKHTPTPWEQGENRYPLSETFGRPMLGVAHSQEAIAAFVGTNAEVDIAFAQRAINSHENLLEACKEFVRFADLDSKVVARGDYIRYQVSAIAGAKDAIATAEGTTP